MSKPPTRPKAFNIVPWTTNGGERIIVYGETGLGKSTLSLISPKPVFLGLDEGAGKLRHPVTGKPPQYVPGIKTFEDVRAALQDVKLFDEYETVVIDTVTILQSWAEVYVVKVIPTEKGAKVKNLMGYGYNKGYKHLYDAMNLILQDCDGLIRRGKNVILVAQAALRSVPNPSGEDFLRSGLRLHVDRSWNIEDLYSEWADHILRIDYHYVSVKEKKASGSTERAIYVQPEVYFRAKSRTVKEAVVSFENKADDSIWKFIFEGKE